MRPIERDIEQADSIAVLASEAVETRLARLAESEAERYRSAEPFPHIALDDFLPAEVMRRVVEAFPVADGPEWERFEAKEEKKKLTRSDVEHLPPPVRDTLYFLNSPVILRFLERLTGIPRLLADPYFYGGGLHQTGRGGHLDVHVDFDKQPQLQLERRINLLLYLNEDWPEAYGGHLELWDRDMTRCVQKILPVFNRCAIFTLSRHSFHGHPEPLRCPEDRSRKSLALYYYTAAESGRTDRHSTRFRSRPNAVVHAARKALPPIALDAFRRARDEAKFWLTPQKDFYVRPPKRIILKNAARRLTPPIVIDAYRRLRGRNGRDQR